MRAHREHASISLSGNALKVSRLVHKEYASILAKRVSSCRKSALIGGRPPRFCHFLWQSISKPKQMQGPRVRTEWFQGYAPEDVFVSYYLKEYTYPIPDPLMNRRIKSLFELYVYGLISAWEFQRIRDHFPADIRTAVAILIKFFQTPICMMPPTSPANWSSSETLLLLSTCVGRVCAQNTAVLDSRSGDSVRMRIRRVVQTLKEAGCLDQQCVPHQERKTVEVQVDLLDDDKDAVKQIAMQRQVRRLKAEVMRKEKRFTKRLYKYRAKIAALSREVAALKKQLTYQLAAQSSEEEETQEETSVMEQVDLMQHLCRECSANISVPAKARQYSEKTLELAQLIKLTSPKAYRVLQQLLPLPCTSCLWNHFSAEVSSTKQFLLGGHDTLFSRIDQLCADVEPGTATTIGVDAFSVRTFTGESALYSDVGPIECSNAFLLLDIPLNPAYPPRVIHILPKKTGNYDSEVSDCVRLVQERMQMRRRQLWFKATDGDPYLNKEHNKFFTLFVQKTAHDFDLSVLKIYEALIAGNTMPIADPLHFGKNIRGKLLDHDVAVVSIGSTFLATNATMLQRALKLGETLEDKSQVGRMRDVYVTRLFTLDNVRRLLKRSDYHSALLLLPYSCVYTALYSSNITPTTRLFLVKLAYGTYWRLLLEVETLVALCNDVRTKYYKKATAVTMAEPVYIKRMIHTCLALGISLIYGPNKVRLDGVGTHLVENAIGLARSLSNSPKFENIVSAFANSEVRKRCCASWYPPVCPTAYQRRRCESGYIRGV